MYVRSIVFEKNSGSNPIISCTN